MLISSLDVAIYQVAAYQVLVIHCTLRSLLHLTSAMMIFANTLPFVVLLTGLAAANDIKLIVTPGSDSRLLARQDGVCKGTCATCFGAGNVVCNTAITGTSCYNPSAGEQCCADGGKSPA